MTSGIQISIKDKDYTSIILQLPI